MRGAMCIDGVYGTDAMKPRKPGPLSSRYVGAKVRKPKPRKESSSELSSIAARALYLARQDRDMGRVYSTIEVEDLIRLAASVLSQDETKGQDYRGEHLSPEDD